MSIAMLAAVFVAAEAPAMPSWLAGSWKTPGTSDEWTEEWWTPPRAGIMLGASRGGKAGALGSFEHMRIISGADGLSFCAMPQGKAGTCFKAVSSGPREIVFENAAHDYPTRIIYRREDWGVVAETSGPNGTRVQRWRYIPLTN